MSVAGHLLNPAGTESSATFVGRLVTCLIRKTGDRLGDNLDLLLKAVLSKLQRSETLSVAQSLILGIKCQERKNQKNGNRPKYDKSNKISTAVMIKA